VAEVAEYLEKSCACAREKSAVLSGDEDNRIRGTEAAGRGPIGSGRAIVGVCVWQLEEVRDAFGTHEEAMDAESQQPAAGTRIALNPEDTGSAKGQILETLADVFDPGSECGADGLGSRGFAGDQGGE
jgi:hypothetical protein